MKKQIKWLIVIAAIALLNVMQTFPNAYAEEKSIKILCGEELVEQVSTEEDQKKVLKAVVEGFEATSYQWQVLVDPLNGIWANIDDKTEAECEVYAALVNSVMDESNSAYLRCAVPYEEDFVYSDPVCVTVKAAMEVPEFSVTDAENTMMTMAMGIAPVAEEDTGSDENIATITIKYLDYYSKFEATNKVEKAIYSPYTARVKKDDPFKQPVISPTFLGFAPYYDYDGDGAIRSEDVTDVNGNELKAELAETFEINIDKVTSDVTYEIYYKAIDVSYAIRYFFQNINDDLYTENVGKYKKSTAETGTIIDDVVIKGFAGDTTGFQKLYHYPESVAADGSTVFECYYDRNYYLIQFDLNGGFGTDPIYARYDAPFIVNDPIYYGYEFAGWKLISVDTDGDGEWENTIPTGVDPDTMMDKIPAYNCYYQAQWNPLDKIPVDIVYWLQDPNETDKYNYWGSYPLPGGARAGSTIDAMIYKEYTEIADQLDEYEKKYSVLNEDRTDQSVTVNGNGTTTVNIYYDRKGYKLKFYYAASEEIDGVDENGNPIKQPQYRVVGGSTYYFGTQNEATDKTNDKQLMDYQYGNKFSEWGIVDELPKLQGSFANYYEPMSETSDLTELKNKGVTYYFLETKDEIKYGADISEIWPCNAFEPVARTNRSTNADGGYNNGWDGKVAIFSAWNGEPYVHYTRHAATLHKDNQTIKGSYEKLDYQLLYDVGANIGTDGIIKDSSTVCYLAFWENAQDKHAWNKPRLWIYRQWVPLLEGEDAGDFNADDIRTVNGVTYKKDSEYITCDNNADIESQTQVSLDGYKKIDGYDENGNYDKTKDLRKATEVERTEKEKELYYSKHIADFYYSRNTYSLKFVNSGTEIDGKTELELPYGSFMDDRFFVPEYPKNLEEDAYEFAGWYTSSGCYAGTEFGKFEYDAGGRYYRSNFEGRTMPNHDLKLYAKWTPVIRQVNFFIDYDAMNDYLQSGPQPFQMLDQRFVEHGTVVGSVNDPTKTGDGNLPLIFAGWFYMDHGVKKAYTPLNMAVNQNLNVFADWSSSKPQPYKISYVRADDPSIKISDDLTGYAYGGTTRTFIPRAGDPYNQLYNDFNKGWFPTVGSHSIVMEYEPDEKNPANNVFTFEYVNATNITYTIRYVNKETNQVIDTVTRQTDSAVVTERFKVITDMVPDAFYKRLVLSVEQDSEGNWVGSKDNVITFYYTPNKVNAYYAVHFMLEKLNATDEDRAKYDIDGKGGYEEAATYMEGVGTINSVLTITPQTFNGFDVITTTGVGKVVIGGDKTKPTNATYADSAYQVTVDADGTELYVFYARKSYGYQVNYYKYNTTVPVNSKDFPSVRGIARYQEKLTFNAEVIPGYTCVSAKTTQTMEIREEQKPDEIKQNVINFYYSPIEYRVEYIAVTEPASETEKGGKLNVTLEVLQGTDEIAGSIPTANNYYRFDGWYKDETCLTPVTSEDGTIDSTNWFKPKKEILDAKNGNKFYAKFVKQVGDFTIARKDADTSIDAGRVFVYEVKKDKTAPNDKTDFCMYVTIEGNGSVTICNLPFGEYTITQKNNWSWRYDNNTVTPVCEDTVIPGFVHNKVKDSGVEFADSMSVGKWLNWNDSVEKQVRGE